MQRVAVALATFLFTLAATQSAYGQSRLITYYFSSPIGCAGKVPSHPTIPVPDDYTLAWSGACSGGYATGWGEVTSYRNGAIVEREIVEMSGGLRNGPSVSINLRQSDPRFYRSTTYARWRNGFPFGEVRIVGSDNNTIVTWETDGAGGVRQTSSPLNPLMHDLGQAASQQHGGLLLFLYLLGGNSSGAQDRRVMCQSMMRSQGFASDVTQFWCTGLPY
jgi:hypothetical protein